jgi:hypothetical protein
MADRSFDVRVEDNSGLGQQLPRSLDRVSLRFIILEHSTFNVGQRRVGVFLGPGTHSVRQIKAPYMSLVTYGNVTSPITQSHRCYTYMHYLLRFTNAREKPRVHESG